MFLWHNRLLGVLIDNSAVNLLNRGTIDVFHHLDSLVLISRRRAVDGLGRIGS